MRRALAELNTHVSSAFQRSKVLDCGRMTDLSLHLLLERADLVVLGGLLCLCLLEREVELLRRLLDLGALVLDALQGASMNG